MNTDNTHEHVAELEGSVMVIDPDRVGPDARGRILSPGSRVSIGGFGRYGGQAGTVATSASDILASDGSGRVGVVVDADGVVRFFYPDELTRLDS